MRQGLRVENRLHPTFRIKALYGTAAADRIEGQAAAAAAPAEVHSGTAEGRRKPSGAFRPDGEISCVVQ